ncbi:MAG: hypothetical protein CMD83_18595 [Gammaproteobacteria bacterium]|nr:hypothetical protein [Gammaproteobacteria bacterium]
MSQRKYQEVVTPGLRRLLVAILLLSAVLTVDSAYLGLITLLTWLGEPDLQGLLYQYAFLAHLVLGVVLIVPALIYSGLHLARAWKRPNRLAVRLGIGLFVVMLALFVSGILLTRGLPLFEVKDPGSRALIYWLHVATPLAAAWLFVLHRLAGKPIRWRSGLAIGALSIVMSAVGVALSLSSGTPPPPGDFTPSLARTAGGGLIAAEALMQDQYCVDCHADVHAQWEHSAHRFASFNNPAYLFSVRNTRKVALERDGDVRAARFCAGCHDPVPLFSGAFDEPDFDDEEHPTAHAGITCTACHAITELGSPRGNGDYIIDAPEHYPFAFSENARLRALNHLLIKGKPAHHRATFLKPLHRTSEFCGTCHKVHLPQALNKYKWLRGQNHYDSFLLSGVSGHGIASFYYPGEAEADCNGCHMPLAESDDFGAKPYTEGAGLEVRGHHFPGANTALPHLLGLPDAVNAAHREILEDSLRVDIFGLLAGNDVDAPITAPLGSAPTATVVPGNSFVVAIVLRTLTVGHLFTEGTADSNQVWLHVELTRDGDTIGTSGRRIDADGTIDPWAHFVNAWVIDRDGRRIDRRNAEDIFTKLYDHQIPPGAADVVFYRFTAPPGEGNLTVSATLNYRKFDTPYMRLFEGDGFDGNDLPVVAIASDSVSFGTPRESAVPAWQRWNDYGIGLLRKPGKGALRQAEQAFLQVAALGRTEGALNLARLYLREGRLEEAADRLEEARVGGSPPWSVAWFSAQVDLQFGKFDQAIEALEGIIATRFADARERGFDFSRDYRVHNRLAQALFERAKLERSDNAAATFLARAKDSYLEVLLLDPENVAAHYGLSQVYARLGDADAEGRHRAEHARYRVDDNARDRAIAAARRANPAADHAADPLVVYDLQRTEGATAMNEVTR